MKLYNFKINLYKFKFYLFCYIISFLIIKKKKKKKEKKNIKMINNPNIPFLYDDAYDYVFFFYENEVNMNRLNY